MFLVEVAAGDIDRMRLTACQQVAASGVYAEAMAGYLAWVAPRLDQVRADMSIDEQRCKLKVRRMILHLPADVLEHPIRKTGPIGPLTCAKNDLPDSHDMGGLAWINGAH
jgi:hypothetical protein